MTVTSHILLPFRLPCIRVISRGNCLPVGECAPDGHAGRGAGRLGRRCGGGTGVEVPLCAFGALGLHPAPDLAPARAPAGPHTFIHARQCTATSQDKTRPCGTHGLHGAPGGHGAHGRWGAAEDGGAATSDTLHAATSALSDAAAASMGSVTVAAAAGSGSSVMRHRRRDERARCCALTCE